MKSREEVTEDNFNRLIGAIIEKNQCSYERANEILYSLKLSIICGESILLSPSLQAAMITAVNHYLD